MKVQNHLLIGADGKPCRVVNTPNVGAELRPKFIVMHYTASDSLDSTVKWLCNPLARASCHLVIDRDGTVVQLAPFNQVTWHAGRSSWNGFVGLNDYSIGIELMNAGRLTRHGTAWRSWFGKDYPDLEVIEATHKHEQQTAGWHLFTQEQIQAAFDVCVCLMDHYKIEELMGHEDISPVRKSDPGPAFPMANFKSKLIGREACEDEVYEATVNLNIRSGPGINHSRISEKPLKKGTRLEILESFGDWTYVNVLDVHEGDADLQGWVFTKYIQKKK